MKTHMKNLLQTSLLLLSLVCVFGCNKVISREGSQDFSGDVEVSPSFAQAGDTVTFDISRLIDTTVEMDGNIIVLTVSYYLDGEKVAEATSEDEKRYKAKYVVKDLEPRTYEVTAHCVSNYENYEIHNNITPAKLTIYEE